MKTTPNLIDGELMIVERHMRLYGLTTRMYSKQSYERSFIHAMGKTVARNYKTKYVTTSETNEHYILRVRN
ncbi:hypothetical protein [Salinicoccus sp. HZC-1]|uniref:hypothetical protein n=1 Tax=Salinicoccus sp. HZC-1 TaxID=3385497 RepID=UPI00398B29F0